MNLRYETKRRIRRPALAIAMAVMAALLLFASCDDGGPGDAGAADEVGIEANGGWSSVCVRLLTPPSTGGVEFVGDPEFDAADNRIAWQDYVGNVYVASLDPTTGLFNGSPELVATDVAPLDRTYNGAEWVFGRQGASLVYTWWDGNGSDPDSFGIGVITETRSGTWEARRIGGLNGYYNPRASKNPEDTTPLVQFLVGSPPNVAWSLLEDDRPVTVIEDSTDGHWAEGEQLLTYIDRISGQVILHNPADPTNDRLLTKDDTTEKERPYMWRAPEFDDRRMFFARVGNKIRVYLERDGNPFVFDLYRTIASPSPPPYDVIASPEPEVRAGHSYISFMASSTTLEINDVVAEIWLAPVALDGGHPFRVSEDAITVRTDPEPFDGSGPMFVYYTRVTSAASGELSESELALYRCATNL